MFCFSSGITSSLPKHPLWRIRAGYRGRYQSHPESQNNDVVGWSRVCLHFPLALHHVNAPVSFLSEQGKCYSFDSRGSGYGRGEGVATVIIKPLKDAIAHGDPIRAVIRNTVLNQDGKTPGLTMPSREAQETLIREAYEQARLDPLDTHYVEAHGTGTKAGDPIEIGAIASALSRSRDPSKPLTIGSVKVSSFRSPFTPVPLHCRAVRQVERPSPPIATVKVSDAVPCYHLPRYGIRFRG